MDADVITIIITLYHHYNHYYMDEIKSSWWFPGKLVLFKDHTNPLVAVFCCWRHDGISHISHVEETTRSTAEATKN